MFSVIVPTKAVEMSIIVFSLVLMLISIPAYILIEPLFALYLIAVNAYIALMLILFRIYRFLEELYYEEGDES